MHRGPTPNYHRGPVRHPRYGGPVPSGPRPPFPDPFIGSNFPPPFPSYQTPLPRPGFQSYNTEPPYQFSSGWSYQQDDLESLEVKKKAEEFLRILEAKDRLQPSGESGDKGTRRPSMDAEAERRMSEKRSRGRSRDRSRSRRRSRGRSRGHSRGKSRGHSRGKSRGRSRGKSRARSRSRSRGKSRTRAMSRPRSRSCSHSGSRGPGARSKSQPRLQKDSQSSVNEAEPRPTNVRAPEMLQNIKQVLQGRDLEKHLTVAQNTFSNKQNHPELTTPGEPRQDCDFNPNPILPHERVGGGDRMLPRILPWNDPGQKMDTFQSKYPLSSIEDEEEFLYGDEDGRKKPQAVTVPLAQTRPAENPTSTLCLSKLQALQEPKGQTMTSNRLLTPDVSVEERERVKNLLKTIGLHLGQTDIAKIAASLKQKQEEQRGAGSDPALRSMLEALMNRNKGQKSDDSRSNRSESIHSHRDKSAEREKEQRDKQIQKKRKEYLVKELEGLLKHEGSGDLIPVIGFFCRRCEEFFGDLKSAEAHKHTNAHQGNNEEPRNQEQQQQRGEKKRPREDAKSTRRTEDKETKERKKDDAETSNNPKKKKKKEKKTKKGKKVKKKKDKSEKN